MPSFAQLFWQRPSSHAQRVLATTRYVACYVDSVACLIFYPFALTFVGSSAEGVNLKDGTGQFFLRLAYLVISVLDTELDFGSSTCCMGATDVSQGYKCDAQARSTNCNTSVLCPYTIDITTNKKDVSTSVSVTD